MNLLQKLFNKLFGFDYVLLDWYDCVEVVAVKRLDRFMVITATGKKLIPGGEVSQSTAKWYPLTKGAKAYYDMERV